MSASARVGVRTPATRPSLRLIDVSLLPLASTSITEHLLDGLAPPLGRDCQSLTERSLLSSCSLRRRQRGPRHVLRKTPSQQRANRRAEVVWYGLGVSKKRVESVHCEGAATTLELAPSHKRTPFNASYSTGWRGSLSRANSHFGQNSSQQDIAQAFCKLLRVFVYHFSRIGTATQLVPTTILHGTLWLLSSGAKILNRW